MRRILIALLLLPLVLVGCQNPGISREPTPYMVMSMMGSSLKISGYLKADHQDVKACLALVEQFMQIYLNQDYQNPTLETKAHPLMTTSTLGDPLEQYVQRYANEEVTVSLENLTIGDITFTGGNEKLVCASVQAEAVVRYSHADWLSSTEAGTDYHAAFQVQLNNDQDGWRVWWITQSQAGA